MRRNLLQALCLAGMLGVLAPAFAQQSAEPDPANPRISFDFANPALTPAAWHIDFDASGVGHYHSQSGDASTPNPQGVTPEPFDQEIAISPTLREALFETARSHRWFNVRCESPHKVAFTGQKTVAYHGPEGQGSCTFNWSPDNQMMKVVDNFQAIAYTLEMGRRLRLEYLHDRLSLDAELAMLSDAAKNGNALEFQNIATELQSIAADPAIMRRAQARAAALLATARAAAPAVSSDGTK